MSNICGIFNLDNTFVGQTILNNITDFSFAKGLTRSSNKMLGVVGLGWSGNSLLDSVSEGQPYTCPLSSVSLVAEARIDNREELIPQLYSKGFIRSKTPKDVEIICAAYACWGKSHPEKLIGDFAYILWDPKIDSLLCVRDPFGSRPLFYYKQRGRSFIAASSIKQIFASQKLSLEIRNDAIAYWLNWQPYDFLTENSFFKDVYRVKPAHVLQIDTDGHVNQWRYWDIDRQKKTSFSDDREYEQAFFHYYSKSVKAISRSQQPATVMTSGGMDSTSIVSMLHYLKKNNSSIDFKMLSILYGEGHPADENQYIQHLAQTLSVELQTINGSAFLPFSENEFNFENLDEPPRYSNSPGWNAAVDKIVSSDSDVAIIGQNADALFTLQPAIFSSLITQGNYRAIIENLCNYPSERRRFIRGEAFRQLARLVTPRFLRSIIRRMNQNRLINPEFIKANQQEQSFFKWASPEYGFEDPTKALQYYLLTDYSYPVRDSYSRIPRQYGLEIRDPFLNRELVEYVISIPATQIINRGTTKSILRNAMQGHTPDLIRQRQGITSFDWLIRQGMTRWLSTNFGSGQSKDWEIVKRGCVLPFPLENRLAKFNAVELDKVKGNLDLSSAQNTLSISRLILLETWLRSLNKS